MSGQLIHVQMILTTLDGEIYTLEYMLDSVVLKVRYLAIEFNHTVESSVPFKMAFHLHFVPINLQV